MKDDIKQTSLIRIDASSYTAILGEPGTKEIQAKAFIDIREPTNLLQQDYFNLFFDRLMPYVAGKKVWTGRDKTACAITDGGKITITDEAFTELCLLNLWDKWSANRPAKWTDASKGNCSFKRMRVKETVVLSDGATMSTNSSLQSATVSGRSVKQTNRRQWNCCFLTMQSNSMDAAPNKLGQGSWTKVRRFLMNW
jgi:hypothetical protein